MEALAEEDPLITRSRARVGTVLEDKWHLDALIGIGGMAAVYSATHRNRKRVAVKVLHVELSGDSEIRQRFLREGYAANAIGHEGAVSVLDDDVTPDGAAFIVMELLEGETLDARFARLGQRLPLVEVLTYTHDLLDVLAVAHTREVVHRDIKPENLFLTRAGKLKVLDFGIARVLEGRQRQSLTLAGTVMGTPAFMAPEQARARWDEVDGQTDLWAVGATMFTLLTGQYVHMAETGNEQLILSATTPARSIGSVMLGLPKSVVTIVDRALAFQKDERWLDAATMQTAVRGALDSLQGVAPRDVPASIRVSPAPDSPMIASQREAPTLMDASIQESVVRRKEPAEDASLPELRALVQTGEQKLAAAAKRDVEIRGRMDALLTERKGLEDWFKRQLGTRTSAVEKAREMYRARAIEIAGRLISDRSVCDASFDDDREVIARAGRMAESREQDAVLHDEALHSYDVTAYRRGLLAGGVMALICLALLAAPIVWRAVRVVEPPPYVPSSMPAPARS